MHVLRSVKNWLDTWGPALLVMSVIFLLSGTPGNDLPSFGLLDIGVKKVGHFLGYCLLAFTYRYALTRGRPDKRLLMVLAVAMAGLYAVTDEFHQSFIAGRTPSAADVGIDTSGALLGSVCWCRVRAYLGL